MLQMTDCNENRLFMLYFCSWIQFVIKETFSAYIPEFSFFHMEPRMWIWLGVVYKIYSILRFYTDLCIDAANVNYLSECTSFFFNLKSIFKELLY